MGELRPVLCCLGLSVLGTMCHFLESQESKAFGTGLVKALEKQGICSHSQSDVVTCSHSQSGAALHSCYSALVTAPGWSAAGGGFFGSTVHVPELHMSVDQEYVGNDLGSISVPQAVSFGSPLPPSRE